MQKFQHFLQKENDEKGFQFLNAFVHIVIWFGVWYRSM